MLGVPCDTRLAGMAMSLAGMVQRLAGVGLRHVGKATGIILQDTRLV